MLIAHDGPPGSMIATVTTLNFGSGVSYDTPMVPLAADVEKQQKSAAIARDPVRPEQDQSWCASRYRRRRGTLRAGR